MADSTEQTIAVEKREGRDVMSQSLRACDIEVVFGYQGGAAGALIHSLTTHNFRMIGGRTEMAAAWMSYGYNRIKRRAASAVLVWHVGALHTSPMIYGATMDGTPLMVIAVVNPPSMDARDMLQESVNVYPALKPLSKYIQNIADSGDLPVIVRQAVKAASTGKFGASVLLLSQTAIFQQLDVKIEPLVLPKPPAPHAEDVAQTWQLLRSAKKPVLFIGAGVHLADAVDELREFAEATGIPVVSTSWGGRGVLSDDHDLYIGASGGFGWISANEALQKADIWLNLGGSFSQMSTGTWSMTKPETVVHVDINENELGKIFEPTLGIQSDAKVFLRELLKLSQDGAGSVNEALADWRAETLDMKKRFQAEMADWAEPDAVPLNQYHVINVLSENLPSDALVLGDSGSQAFALYRAYKFRDPTPRPTGGHYMSLGAGLPVAIGAKLADPSREVVVFHGDGGFYYDLSDLSTLAEHRIKVIVIIDNNGALLANRSAALAMGMGDNPWADLPETTDFVTVAKGFGVDGERVETPDQLAPAIQRALASESSYLIDVRTTAGMRIRRALTNIIPIVGDRQPKAGHLALLDGSWPN